MIRNLIFLVLVALALSACATTGTESARPTAAASPTPDAAQLGAAVTAKEKAVWEALKNKQFDEARKLWADDYTGVYDYGILNVEQDLAGTRDFELKSYSLADIKTTIPNRETAIITYKATVKASLKGKDMSGTYHVASVWRERNGDWQTVLHTDMKAQ
jgi:hypothetical protein